MKRHETRALESPTKVRYLVLLALALAVASAYLTRVMSAASTTIQREFGLSNEEMGYILSGFFFGYIWFQLPGGWIANRFGTRMVLPALSILWSVSAIWISVARSGIPKIVHVATSGAVLPVQATTFSIAVPKSRMISSSSDTKNRELPGSPCRPDRPRN